VFSRECFDRLSIVSNISFRLKPLLSVCPAKLALTRAKPPSRTIAGVMSFADLPIFNLMQQKMTWLGNRQDVLSRNIANASTPGYAAQDLRADDFAKALSGASRGDLLTSNAKHLTARSLGGGAYQVVAAPGSQSSPDGNSVVLEEQAMKVSETQMQYAEAAGLYKKMISMWRTALSGRA
jgi:flagellar basal-body rod protein FlgB